MRDTDRIERIVDKIEKLWKKYPDLRFGQLLLDFVIPEDIEDYWYIEDDGWEECLNQAILNKEAEETKCG